MSRLKTFLVACTGLAATIPAGCASSEGAGRLETAVAAYDARDYEESHRQAKAIADEASGRRREQAAYVAGLSAYRLGRSSEAETDLLIAVRSGDTETRAKAQAMLGLVRLDQHRPNEATSLLADAADDLEGDDAMLAARYARRASTGTASTIGEPRQKSHTTLAQRSNAGAFTLQIGAFRELSRAESAARSVSAMSAARAYGAVEIVLKTDARGRRLHHVHLGRFNTRQAAASARQRLGRSEFIVVAADQAH